MQNGTREPGKKQKQKVTQQNSYQLPLPLITAETMMTLEENQLFGLLPLRTTNFTGLNQFYHQHCQTKEKGTLGQDYI